MPGLLLFFSDFITWINSTISKKSINVFENTEVSMAFNLLMLSKSISLLDVHSFLYKFADRLCEVPSSRKRVDRVSEQHCYAQAPSMTEDPLYFLEYRRCGRIPRLWVWLRMRVSQRPVCGCWCGECGHRTPHPNQQKMPLTLSNPSMHTILISFPTPPIPKPNVIKKYTIGVCIIVNCV